MGKPFRILIGIDEAGRGPIAGPVSVGVFAFLNEKAANRFRGVKECKQLSEERREGWYKKILDAKAYGYVDFSVKMESEKVIDEKGIAFAIRSALRKGLKEIGADPKACRILLDGGLKAPKAFKDQKTIIKGDEKERVIALASICAKVTRDRHMREMSKVHGGYGFDAHKGYGTSEHYDAIRRLGSADIHRKTFLHLEASIGASGSGKRKRSKKSIVLAGKR